MVLILEENYCILSYTKNTNFWQIYAPIRSHKFLFFCSLKYNAISTKTSHEYPGYVYVFME
jgi:hypothetical protein